MTTIQRSTSTTTPVRRAASTPPLTSYDFTGLDSSTRMYLPKLQSSIAQVIEQWWRGLTNSQRSVLNERALSLKISGSCSLQLVPPGQSVKV